MAEVNSQQMTSAQLSRMSDLLFYEASVDLTEPFRTLQNNWALSAD